uniref:Autophagy-related protein 13 n=1 Tax=Culicoides sonorensis TaxID=179676 RepID=A0A336LVL8_CULSO
MSNKLNATEIKEIDKFLKFLVLKSTQVIVQSRLGEKIRTEPNLTGSDWFNIAIYDHQDVLNETRKALQISTSESVIPRLPLCVEISLQTVEGDKMILEVWSLAIQVDQVDPTQKLTYAHIYNRMGILLKSLISVTRVTPAYKLSRRQSPDSFHIYYRIYCGAPQEHNLGEGYKQVRVGQLSTSLGTLNMAVAYRTKMTITPTQTIGRDSTTLLLKSTDPHWNLKDLSPKHRYQNYGSSKKSEKKVIDIDKPMRRGAFVDESFAKQYTEADFSLPETPPFSWLLRKPTTTTSSSLAQKDDGGASDLEDILATSPPSDENSATALNTTGTSSTTTTTNNNNASVKSLENPKSSGAASPKSSNEQLTGTSPSSLNEFKRSSSRWSTRTLPGEDEKLFKELHFPFATQNTPISDLAKFYRECFNAPPLQQFAEIDNPTATGTGTVLSGSGDDAEATSATSSSSCRLGANNADFVARNSSIDDLTKQLEEFETSLGDYDTLVTSLCQQSSEVDNNSNS